MKHSSLTESDVSFLRSRRVARLATISLRGTPQVTPVCYVVIDNSLYVKTGGETQKVKNIIKNPNVALVVDDYSENWNLMRGIAIVGQASLLERGEEFTGAREALLMRYPQFNEFAPIVEGQTPIMKIEVLRKYAWDYSHGNLSGEGGGEKDLTA